MKIIYKRIVYLILILISFLLLLQLSFVYDNKYTASMPLGQDGILTLTNLNTHKNRPIYLIDGWQRYNGNLLPSDLNEHNFRITYIGEFSNFGQENHSPHSEITYKLNIEYFGEDTIVQLHFPYLYTDYQLWWNGILLEAGKNVVKTNVYLKQGTNELVLNVTAKHGYYSGMYFPGSISSGNALGNTQNIQTMLYSIAFLCPVTLALFTILLWNKTKDKLRLYFAFLCLSNSLYVTHYFVQLWALPIGEYWYVIQDLALYSIVYFAICTILMINTKLNPSIKKYATIFVLGVPIIELLLCFFAFPWGIELHASLQDIYRIVSSVILLYGGISMITSKIREHFFVLLGNIMLGVGLLINIMYSNLFEPILGLWQFEWCGLFAVLLFGVMMVEQNKRIIVENMDYQTHLENMVKERTSELSKLLEERRQFFSDMAHDLKAPVFSIKTFMEMIRHHGIGIDSQLDYYISQVEQKQGEISKRVQSLNELNLVDKITAPKEYISITEFLKELKDSYQPDAAVREIYLCTIPLKNELFVWMQREKLTIVFENLIYNAMLATSKNGQITISAKSADAMVYITVEDTGCGISEEELPLVFNRFFVGNNNKSSGSGLGLYIVKTIINENSGEISVKSILDKGTSFTLFLPETK